MATTDDAGASLRLCEEADAKALLGSAARESLARWSPWGRIAIAGTTLLGLIAAGVIVSAPRVSIGGSQVSIPADAALVQEYGAGGAWVVCTGPDSCGQVAKQAWAASPSSLAARVGSLASLPGVPGGGASVLQQWRTSPPSFKGSPVTLAGMGAWMQALLSSDPFGTANEVPYVDFQAGDGKMVAITQRQLAFIVANVLMGNSVPVGDGLSQAIHRCTSKGNPQIVKSLLSMLAILSRELAAGGPGAMLIGANPGPLDQGWMAKLETSRLTAPTVCQTMGQGSSPSCGMSDFMTAGTPRQAMTDIAGTVVGGGSQLCDLANSQDESLVQFYGEVLAFSFFVATSNGPKMLPVPWVLLGARPYMNGISGESAVHGTCGHVATQNWLNEGILETTVEVQLGDQTVTVVASSFVAVASKCSAATNQCPVAQAMNNMCDRQRRHLAADVALWYQAFEPTLYPASMQQAFSSVIQRIGTGPWGAGVWYGDAQQYFLATWLATSLLSHQPHLDYYVYDHFCENQGHQCFVLGSSGCSSCLAGAGVDTNQIQASRCGTASIQQMIQMYNGLESLRLFNTLKAVGSPPSQVFDLLLPLAPQIRTMAMQPAPVAPAQPVAPVAPPVGEETGEPAQTPTDTMTGQMQPYVPPTSPRTVMMKVLGVLVICGGIVLAAMAMLRPPPGAQAFGGGHYQEVSPPHRGSPQNRVPSPMGRPPSGTLRGMATNSHPHIVRN